MSSSAPIEPVPQTMYIPKRSDVLNYCWVATRHVVSIYFTGKSAFVELDNKRTVRLDYETAPDAATAAAAFNRAMTVYVTKLFADNNWPKPTGGSILTMA